MSGPNGHVHENSKSIAVASPAVSVMPAVPQLSAQESTNWSRHWKCLFLPL